VIDATPVGLTGVSISGYTYSMFDVQFTADGKKHKVYADTGYSRPLVDRDWLAGHPDFTIDTEQSITVKGIGSRLKLYGLVIFALYVPGKVDSQETLGKVTIRAWVTENLEPRLLLGNEFLHPHGTIIDLKKNEIIIGVCKDLAAPIIVYHKGRRILRKVLAAKAVTIPPRSTIAIPSMCASLPKGRSYMFEASYDSARDAIIEYVNFVAVTNPSDKAKKIPAKTRLGIVMEFEEEGCYLV